MLRHGVSSRLSSIFLRRSAQSIKQYHDPASQKRRAASAIAWQNSMASHVRATALNNTAQRYKTTDAHSEQHASPNEDRMLIGFTCKVCNHRQYKTMSKNAYKNGVVLIQCDDCKNRHLIADNLSWFRDKSVNIEKLMSEKGEEVRQLKDMGLLDGVETDKVTTALKDYEDVVARRSTKDEE